MLTSLIAAAQGGISNPALGSLGQRSGESFFGGLLPALFAIAFIIGSLIFFYMLVSGAIQWISSGGDKQALESARGKISNALIGLIILFASYAIIKIIEAFFHVSILSIDIGALKI